MTDILLFNQYFTSKKELPEFVTATLPINLLNLASFIIYKGFKCKIYDLGIFNYSNIIEENDKKIRCGISDDEIINIINKENPKIIGIGCLFTMYFWDVLSIARLIKKVNSKIKVVLGGNHATIFAKDILKESSIDFIVRGEGEITFYELCNNIINNHPSLDSILGLTYRNENGEIISNPDRPLISNLDDLPMIDYSLVDLKKYAIPINKSPYVMRYPLLGIMTSRGCPGKCVFCTVKAVWGRTWRGRSAKKVVDEIELLITNYGIREISFLDDSVSVNKNRWGEICNEILKRKLDIKWTTPNGIAYWTLDKKILGLMKKAGCYRITFGIESGNVETRKFIGKSYSLSLAKDLIEHANKIGMWTICTNIIGFPYETKEQIYDTINFAKISGTDFAVFYLLSPFLTSDVYAYFKKEGLLDYDTVLSDNWLNDVKYEKMFETLSIGGFSTKYLNSTELKKIQMFAYRSFIFYRIFSYIINPLRLLRKIKSFEDFKYFIKLFITGINIVFKGLLSFASFSKKSPFNLFYKKPEKLTFKK